MNTKNKNTDSYQKVKYFTFYVMILSIIISLSGLLLVDYKNIIFISTLIGIIVIIFLLYKDKIMTKDLLEELSEKSKIIDELNQEITQLKSELSHFKTVPAKKSVKETLEDYKKLLTNDFSYFRFFNKYVCEQNELLLKSFNDYFIIEKPRDLISGDFYYIWNLEQKKYLFFGDSTGHGIEAGKNVNYANIILKELLNKKTENKNLTAIQILKLFQVEFSKYANNEANNPNIELALCIFDFQEKKIQFSINKQKVYIVSSEKLIEIKSERKNTQKNEIGIDEFQNIDYNYTANDIIYFVTDGFSKQIGGENKQSFSRKNLKSLILENSNNEMAEQKIIIQNKINNWILENQQLDDILMIGIKI